MPETDGYNIHWESGIHIPVNQILENRFSRFNQGDPTTRMWNPAVAARLAAYQPDIISIDTLPALRLPPEAEVLLTQEVSLTPLEPIISFFLPARPADINPTGEIAVLGGDSITYYSLATAPQFSYDLLDQVLRSQLAEGVFWRAEFILKLGLLLGLNLRFGSDKLPGLGYSPSRRQFLKLAASFPFWLYLLASWVPYVSSLAKSEPVANVFDNLAPLAKPLVVPHPLVLGRTALLIAKTQDAVSALGLPPTTPAAVLMGAAHGVEGPLLLNNRELRKKAISELAETTLKLADELISGTGLQRERNQIANDILDYTAAATIFKATDTHQFFPDTSVSFNTNFRSQEVMEAIEPLRPS